MDGLLAPVLIRHADLAKIVLRKLARQAFEPHVSGRRPLPVITHQ